MGAALLIWVSFYVSTPFTIASGIMIILCLPFGYFTAIHKPTRYVLIGLIALSIITFGVIYKIQNVEPSMAAIGLVLLTILLVAVILSVPIGLSVACWKKSHPWFFVRLAILCALILLGLYFKIGLTDNTSDSSGYISILFLSIYIYFIWLFCMLTGDKQINRKGSSRINYDNDTSSSSSSSSDSSSSSSSSSDSYSGSGGSSGGGGASGSW
jgi:uncharacterized protein